MRAELTARLGDRLAPLGCELGRPSERAEPRNLARAFRGQILRSPLPVAGRPQYGVAHGTRGTPTGQRRSARRRRPLESGRRELDPGRATGRLDRRYWRARVRGRGKMRPREPGPSTTGRLRTEWAVSLPAAVAAGPSGGMRVGTRGLAPGSGLRVRGGDGDICTDRRRGCPVFRWGGPSVARHGSGGHRHAPMVGQERAPAPGACRSGRPTNRPPQQRCAIPCSSACRDAGRSVHEIPSDTG